ncbi:NAD(P)-binding protein [Polychaeton citri CBS 116435]|uniref:NAD(P)-binding protein n=1 Tax=Polychaeton citri CBS 116435 TaxID=1314669 RepID=A0A9P4Q2H3_9PEZI|nr:NAD(P)-binding protein [Polychaeton citri CBS 116435]
MSGFDASAIDPKRPWPSFTPTYHHDVYPAIDPTQPALDCSDKVVLITGAGSGIGKGIALAFAQAHAKGIALLGRTTSTLESCAAEVTTTSEGRTATFVCTADITKQDEVQAALAAAARHLGNRIDVLVSNAGGVRAGGPLADIDIGGVWQTYELNVLGPLIVTQAFRKLVPTSAAPDSPRTVVSIPSGAAHLPYAPGGIAYSTSKLANAKIVEYLHHEHPTWGVFNMQPGVVDTELARAAGRKAPDSPALPGGFAVWLAAHPDARYLNGRFIWSNWDIDEVLQRKDEIVARDLLTLGLKGWAEDTPVEHLVLTAKALHRNADKK